MIKKFLSVLLCMALALPVVSAAGEYSVSAETAAYSTIFYYDQLSDNAQEIFEQLREAVIDCEPVARIRTGTPMTDEEFNMVSELLVYHDPVTFHIRSIEARWNSLGYSEFHMDYNYSKEDYDEMTAACDKRAEEIISKLNDDMTKYTKIRTIHDAIVDSTVYDAESTNGDNIYGILVKNTGKCDGYAKAFSYLCSKIGIRTVTVIGHSYRDKPDEMHMWNKVYYNNKWYNVDVTWDDPLSNTAENSSHSFFMLADSELSASHTEDNQSFAAPRARDDTISYFEVNKKYADSLDSAKKIIKNGLTSQAKKGKSCFEFQCSSKEVFNKVTKFLNDAEKTSEILKTVKKNSGKDVITGIYSLGSNDKVYTIRIIIFFENTDMDNYFTDTSALSDKMLKNLAEQGVK